MKKDFNGIKKIEVCITSKCNLNCKHCYQHFEKNKYIISFEKIKEIIEYANKSKSEHIVLSGGEFFTHPNSYDIIKEVTKYDIPLTIVTNGTLIDTERIKQFIGKNITFQISIDGTEDYHDSRRGIGNYAKTVDTIKKIRNMGFKVNIYMTIDNNNYITIPEVLNNNFYDSVTFMPVAIAGAATINSFDESKELDDCIETIYKMVSTPSDICHRCNIFPKGISINYEGFVFPCSIARDYKLFPLGNINDDSLENIITNFVNSDKSNLFFEYKSNSQIEKCSKCSKNKECNQGCRMRAFKFNGNMLSHDPFCCKIYNNEYKKIGYGHLYWGDK